VRTAAAQQQQAAERARLAVADAQIAATRAQIVSLRSGSASPAAAGAAAVGDVGAHQMRITRVHLPPPAAAAGGRLLIRLPDGKKLQITIPPAGAGGARRGIALQLRPPSLLPRGARPSWVGPLCPSELTDVGDTPRGLTKGFFDQPAAKRSGPARRV
jgi:hypothetical protein